MNYQYEYEEMMRMADRLSDDFYKLGHPGWYGNPRTPSLVDVELKIKDLLAKLENVIERYYSEVRA